MENRPLISVILPIYNKEKYLDKCMESLMSQSYQNIEIVMVDDGSLDSCPVLCDEYEKKDSRVSVFHKENGGISDARNYGIEHAKGEYITYIDPDDYVDIDYLEYLYRLLCRYNTKMSICQHRVCFQNGKITDYGNSGDEVLSPKECIERMSYHDIIDTSAWGKLYHRSLFENVRYPKGKIFEDMAITYVLFMKCDKIAVGYESKYNYIFHDNSIVNSSFNTNKLDLLEMTDKMAADVTKKYPELEDAVLRRRVYARISTINQMLNAKDCDDVRKDLLQFIKQHRKKVFFNKKTPKRDKFALLLLSINFGLYKRIWMSYRKNIMKEE